MAVSWFLARGCRALPFHQNTPAVWCLICGAASQIVLKELKLDRVNDSFGPTETGVRDWSDESNNLNSELVEVLFLRYREASCSRQCAVLRPKGRALLDQLKESYFLRYLRFRFSYGLTVNRGGGDDDDDAMVPLAASPAAQAPTTATTETKRMRRSAFDLRWVRSSVSAVTVAVATEGIRRSVRWKY